MADRFWVGGTESWNGTAGSKWSTTSGGAGGAAEPTAADDVKFDGNSGAVTVTVATSARPCRSINFTGFTGTFAGSVGLEIGDATRGDITLGSGMTFTHTGVWSLLSTATTNQITSNGISFGGAGIQATGNNGKWTLQDAFTSTRATGGWLWQSSSLDTNGQSVTIACAFKVNNFGGSAQNTITLGASTITLTGDNTTAGENIWLWNATDFGGGIPILSAGTSTIIFSNISSDDKTFQGGAVTYNNFSITGGGTGIVIVQGSNTFANFPQITGGTKNLRFTAGTTQTFTGGADFGNGSNLITIDTQTAESAATLSKSSGIVSCTSISLKDSTATGGATWYAGPTPPSVNVSGNTGWAFNGPLKPGFAMFFLENR